MTSRYVSTTEILRLREKIGAGWLPLWISLETGLRVGDVVKIRGEDITSEGLKFVAQKTGKAGLAQISASLRNAMLDRLHGSKEWLFPGGRDSRKHMTRQAVWKRMKTAARRAGLECAGVSPHSMRKAFAVGVYKARGLAAAQKGLQHDDAEVTERYVLADFLRVPYAPLLRRDIPILAHFLKQFLQEDSKK